MSSPPAPDPDQAALHDAPNRRNLRGQPAPIIGRTHEVWDVCGLIGDGTARLVTLTGAPGSGKTRLAHAIATQLGSSFPDGSWFIGLEAARTPGQVIAAIGQALRVPEEAGRPPRESLAAAIADRHILLVLDNFEQVLDAAAEIAALLAECPGLVCLVTSRAALHLRWEHEYPVLPLALPAIPPDAGGQRRPSRDISPEMLGQIAASPAVQLFVQRARSVQPAFTLSPSTAAAVAAICTHLDGLPLAIELAAARVKFLSPAALRERLHRRLSVLAGGPRDLPARQQTLRAALSWSYDLLPAGEQRRFRRLGVFAGGFTIEAAAAVAGEAEAATGRADVEGTVATLISSSLLAMQANGADEARYHMLETVREYALELLTEAHEGEEIRRRHAMFFTGFVEAARPRLLEGGQQAAWLARLDAEYDNIRTALEWSVSAPGEAETAVRLGGSLFRYWSMRSQVREGRHWLRRVLAVSEGVPAGIRGMALNAAGLLARQHNDYERATAWLEESLHVAQRDRNQRAMAVALHNLALVAQHGRADYPAARTLYEQSLQLSKELGNTWGMAAALNNLGGVAIRMGDYLAAETYLAESLALCRSIEDVEGTAHALGYLGTAALRQGDFARAAVRLGESIEQYAALGNRLGVAQCLEEIAAVAAGRGRPGRAAHLLGAAAALREAIAVPGDPADLEAVRATLTIVRDSLGGSGFARAWDSGRDATADAAVKEALTEAAAADGDPEPRTLPTTYPAGLTPREVEVLALLAGGCTNREIAVQLVVSVATVERHIANLYAKIGARGRADATAFALRNGLMPDGGR